MVSCQLPREVGAALSALGRTAGRNAARCFIRSRVRAPTFVTFDAITKSCIIMFTGAPIFLTDSA